MIRYFYEEQQEFWYIALEWMLWRWWVGSRSDGPGERGEVEGDLCCLRAQKGSEADHKWVTTPARVEVGTSNVKTFSFSLSNVLPLLRLLQTRLEEVVVVVEAC